VALDEMEFNADGSIKTIVLTREGFRL
jgi:hypothetical protein